MPGLQTHFLTEPLTLANYDECETLWGDRAALTAPVFARVFDRARRLLREGRARGRVIRDGRGGLRAFGLAAFVRPAVGDRLAASTAPQLGLQLLGPREWDAHVLTPDDVARANAGGGLDLLVVNQGHDATGLEDDEWATLVGHLIQGFLDTHRGFKVRRTFVEAFGPRGVAFLAPVWPEARCDDLVLPDGGVLPSVRVTITQATAERQGGVMLPLFVYRPPVLGLSPAEREMLAAALTSGTDAAIADALRLSIATVKSRWSRIFQRVAATPLADRLAPARSGAQRGPQQRHILLEFLRQNPWELTGYAPSADDSP